jgi:hypothetical protein
MKMVLSRIADHPINRIEELLPWNLAAASVDEHVVTAQHIAIVETVLTVRSREVRISDPV